jgi:hypothetical protein
MAKRKQSRRANLDAQNNHAVLSRAVNRKRGMTKQRLAATLGSSANSFGSNAKKEMIEAQRSGGRSQDRPPLSMGRVNSQADMSASSSTARCK